MRRSLYDTLNVSFRSAVVVFTVVAGLSLVGCSSSRTTADDEYFDPLRMTTPDPDRALAITYFKPRPADPGRIDTLQKAVQFQNERITKLERDLAVVATRQGIESAERDMASRDKSGEETLLALIREQNLRLDEIMEQVRFMGEKKASMSEVEMSAPASPSVKQVTRAFDARAYGSYGRAIAAYNRKEYRVAIRNFEASLSQGIRSSLSDNCRFWIGVSRFQLRDFRGSLASLELVTRDRSSDKRSSALLIAGQVYDQLGRRDLARNAYERIVRDYPRSNLRTMAEQKISSRFSGGFGGM